MIVFDDAYAITKIADSAKVAVVPILHRCVARLDPLGNVLGGVIYTDYTGASVQMHVAGFSPRWLNKSLLYCVFDYPFNYLKVKKVVGIVDKSNAEAVRLDEHLGFRVEAQIEDIFPAGPALVMTMRREECRFLDLPKREKRGLPHG